MLVINDRLDKGNYIIELIDMKNRYTSLNEICFVASKG